MPLTTAGANLALDYIGGNGPSLTMAYVAVHNVDAPTDNTTEPSGGTPAYARKAVSFASANAGSMAQDGSDPVFDIPAGFTVKSIGYWSALTVGTLIAYANVTDEVFANQGTYTLDTTTVTIT